MISDVDHQTREDMITNGRSSGSESLELIHFVKCAEGLRDLSITLMRSLKITNGQILCQCVNYAMKNYIPIDFISGLRNE